MLNHKMGVCLFSRNRYAGSSIRSVFSLTGAWERKLTTKKKREVEAYWGPKLVEADQRKKPGKLGKYYVLSMFPYPSGRLHMGHVRVYAISDAMARYRKLQGYEVIHPMGWDAFGLPAENAAFEQNTAPQVWIEANISHMKKQLIGLGFGFDWDREVRTCDPAYYKWTQYLFLKLWEKGLVYQKEAYVNWDPVDQTVLANEQVDENGCSWRSGARVEKKLLRQWFIRTSHYAAALRDALASVEHWRDIVAIQQHWIGEITGHWSHLELHHADNRPHETFPVFSSNPDDAMDGEFVALAPSHEFCKKYGPVSDELYGTLCGEKRISREGLLNVECWNKFAEKWLPVYKIDEPGHFDKDCDVQLGVPAKNERDRLFAEKRAIVLEHGDDARRQDSGIQDRLKNLYVSPKTSAKLQDWLISRQRYWGTPIPIVHCGSCGAVPVPEKLLPITLPSVDGIMEKGMNLRSQSKWIDTECPKCGNKAARETDTMDTFVDSSWYFLRYLDPLNSKEPFSKETAFAGMPVDVYVGGKEHALLHLFYARFFGYFLYDQGLLPEPEPFKQLLAQGFVMGKSSRSGVSGRYLKPDELDSTGSVVTEKATGKPVIENWEKMSKSRFNGLDPDDAVEEYGVDATRLFMMGNISPRSHRRWDPELFKGLLNWQNSLWASVEDYIRKNSSDEIGVMEDSKRKAADLLLWDSRNYCLKSMNHAMDVTFSFNIAVSRLHGLTTSLRKVPPAAASSCEEYRKTLEQIIVMLFPFCPHFAAELWSGVRSVPKASNVRGKDVWDVPWPQLDYSYPLDLDVKVCGEELTTIKVPRPEFDVLDKQKALSLALGDKNVAKWITSEFDAEQSTFTFHKEFQAFIDLHDNTAAQQRKTNVKQEKLVRKEARQAKKSAAA